MTTNKPYMNYCITNATPDDLAVVCQLFEDAIVFQKKHHYTGWNSYDKDFIKRDIEQELLYKITSPGAIVCIFSICYNDALIWRAREKADAIYLHRIVLNRQFSGQQVFQQVLDWAIPFALEKKRNYIRMDTWADNTKLISYYISYGFRFIENYTTPDTTALPLQHRNLRVALLEFTLPHDSNTKYHSMNNKLNIREALSTIRNYWSQQIIGEANGQLIKLAKGTGEINWHRHDDQDELFILFKGHLTIQLRDRNIELYPYDMFIVPKGVEHCPNAHVHAEFLIMGLGITSNAAGGRPEKWSDEV